MEKHGYRKHPLYKVWDDIKQRCYNRNSKSFKYYGKRNIVICDKWKYSAKKFIEWALENGWKRGLYIDRIDNDGNYTPKNCRFVTAEKSVHNQRLLWNTNTSGYRGIYYENNKWRAQIMIDNKRRHLGSFNSARLAAIRYDVEAYLNGDERPRNFI